MSKKINLLLIAGIIVGVIIPSFIFLKYPRQQEVESIPITPTPKEELVQQLKSLLQFQGFPEEITEEGKQELIKAIASNPLSPKDILNNEDIESLVENKIIGENEGKWLLGLEKLLTVTK